MYTNCTITKNIKLGDYSLEITVMIHKSVKKEMVETNNPRKEFSRVPMAWRNADGSRIQATPATPQQ